MQKSGFWDNHKKATEISEELSNLKEEVEFWEKIDKEIEMVDGEEKLKILEKKIANEEIKVFLSGKYDKRDAILTIFSGAGGVDAQDWAEMLLRMYLKYAEKHKFKARVMHITEGQEAGIKNVTLEISGNYAFGHLKREAGVHRLVRLSPFNADNLRQTSFALVEALPDFSEISQIKIIHEDLKVDTYKASGPGGQYVNKTESAVRITHIPTGIVVACQSERLQGSNKERAMKLLQIKLFQKQLESQEKEKKEIKGEKISAGWGYQIRSYVLHPYKMVKDLRTGVESSNPDKILDGDLDEFIEAEIRSAF